MTPVLAALLIAATASAEGPVLQSSINTPDLVEGCLADGRDLLAADFCTGYVLGTFDRLSATRQICPIYGSATASAMGVAVKFLRDHPERWSEGPSFLLTDAFKKAYPCR